MNGTNHVQDRIDVLEAAEEAAHDLLERTLQLARRQGRHRPGPPLAGRTLRLAVSFHRRAETAAVELADFINRLERNAR